MSIFFAVTLQAQTTVLDKYAERADAEVTQLEAQISSDVPALRLTDEQRSSIQEIFVRRYEKAMAIDPYEVGKLKASKMYEVMHADAVKDALAQLSLEQRLAYDKYQNKQGRK